MQTTITVRPAARGGKYLGPDAANSNGQSAIAGIIDINSLEVIDACFVNATAPADAGPLTLMNPVARSDAFATDSNTVNAILSVDISVPETYFVVVAGPLSYLDQTRLSVGTITVLPGVNIGDPDNFPEGLVLEIPGLCISNVESVVTGAEFFASAEVTMMCGCKISAGSLYWPPTDFYINLITVTASGNIYTYALSFNNSPTNPSSFVGSWPNQAPSDPVVEAWISASQPKLGNQGRYTILSSCTNEKENVLVKKVFDFLGKK